MNTSLKIRVKSAAGSLTRVLGMVERRGFVPVSLSATLGGDGCGMDLYMTVNSGRPVEQLVLQLKKNHDILNLEVLQ